MANRHFSLTGSGKEKKFLVSHVEHLWLVQGSLCCYSHEKGYAEEKLKGEWVCCFGQSGFAPDLLPWRLKGSHFRLDQGTDDTERPLLRSGLCSLTCGPAQRSRLGNWRGQVAKYLSAFFH